MKMIKEYINEKFIEGGDPIKDMGIGVGDPIKWENLDNGDILEIKKFIGSLFPGVGACLYILRGDWYDILKEQRTISFYLFINRKELKEWLNKPVKPKKYLDSWRFGKKFYKEHFKPIRKWELFEKFSENSDPIDDLHIGIKHKYKEWLNEFKKMLPGAAWNLTTVEGQLLAVIDQEKFEFIEYVIKSLGADPNFDNVSSLRLAAFNKQFEMCIELIKYGADLNKAITEAEKWNLNTTKRSLTFLKKLITQNNKIKKSRTFNLNNE